jgi:hypothetical protein
MNEEAAPLSIALLSAPAPTPAQYPPAVPRPVPDQHHVCALLQASVKKNTDTDTHADQGGVVRADVCSRENDS